MEGDSVQNERKESFSSDDEQEVDKSDKELTAEEKDVKPMEENSLKDEGDKSLSNDDGQKYDKAGKEFKAGDVCTERQGLKWIDATSPDNTLLCNPCLFDESEEKACGFCVICVEYLCQACCRDHKKSKSTRNHSILKDKLPDNTKVFRLMKELTSCSEHTDMQVSHKCEDHNNYVCLMCIAGNHRKCDHVIELVTEVSTASTRALETAEKLHTIQETSKQVIKKRLENITVLAEEKSAIQSNNASLLQQIQETLMLLDQDSRTKTEKVTESAMQHLQKDIDICKSSENELLLFTQLLDMAKEYGSNTDVNIIVDAVEEKVCKISLILEKQRNKNETHLIFKQNPLMSKIKSLGQLTVQYGNTKVKKPTESYTSELEGSSDEVIDRDQSATSASNTSQGTGTGQGAITGKKKPKQKRVKKEMKFPVKLADDAKDCTISGIVILQDGRVVVIDKENNKVKVFSSGAFKFIFAHCLDAQPNDVCRFGPKPEIAVVYKDLKQIDKFTITGKTLNVVRCWKTKYENIRISLDRELIAVICRADKNVRVQLRRDTDCKVLLEASLTADTGQELDLDGCSLCSVKDGLVVAIRSMGIMFLARTNNLESLAVTRTLNFNEVIPDLRGITADKEGNLYVCAPSSRSVIQISSEGYSSLNTDISGIDMPLSLAITNKKDRIFVGCQNDDHVHVCKIKK